MFDLAGSSARSRGQLFDQEIVLTVDIRILLLVAMIMVAGCMPAKHAGGPSPVEPMATQDAGVTQMPETAVTGETTPEDATQAEDVDQVDVLQEREDVPEADTLSTEEQKILDSELSFHVGLNTDENADVQRYFHYYTHLHRGTMDGWLKRAQRYLPHIRDRFLAEGLPEDLIYLPFAESGFNPFALSRAGASGVWQFMPQTGINYGLVVDAWIDERRDPYASTEAAIKYLKKLYADFGDWSLALAAYNAGEGAIGKALEKTGCEDYFSLCAASNDLKQETKLYVPKFLALVKIARNLEALGFAPIDWSVRPASLPTLQAKPGTDLFGLARALGMEWKAFRELNPVLRKQEAPPKRGVKVAVPGHLIAKAQEYLKRPIMVARSESGSSRHTIRPGDTWWGVAKKYGVSVKALQGANQASEKQKLQVGKKLLIPGGGAPTGAAQADTRKWAERRANYVVRQGDTIWSIAKQFQADPASLLQTNGLSQKTTLKIGQKLFIPDAGTVQAREALTKAEEVRRELVNYQVRPGDSLWNIAKRFGVSLADLRQWNKLAENAALKPGDELSVYR